MREKVKQERKLRLIMKKKLVGNKITTKNKILVFSLIFSNYHFRRKKR